MAIAIAMSTTIQVSKKTARILKELMKKTNTKTYDELIRIIISEQFKLHTSLFSSNPKLTSFKEEEEAEFHEL
jgi:flagellar motor component MotA